MFIQSGLRPAVQNSLKLLNPRSKLPHFLFIYFFLSSRCSKEDPNYFRPTLMSCFCFPIFNLFVDVRIVLWIQTKVLRPAFIDGRTALRLTPAVCHSVQPQLSSTLLCFHGIPKDKALKKRWAGQIRWDDFTITKQKSAVDTFEEQKPCRASSSIFQNMCDKECSPGALAFSLGMERATKLKHFPERWSPCFYQTFKTLLCTFQHSTGDNNVYVIHIKLKKVVVGKSTVREGWLYYC